MCEGLCVYKGRYDTCIDMYRYDTLLADYRILYRGRFDLQWTENLVWAHYYFVLQTQRKIWSGSILHILQLQIAYVHPVNSTYLFSWFNHNLTHSLVTPYKSLKPLCLCSYTAVKSALWLITQDFFDLTLKELVNPCPCQTKSNLNYWRHQIFGSLDQSALHYRLALVHSYTQCNHNHHRLVGVWNL